MADIVVYALYSCLYLEATKKHEIQALQSKYDFHLENKGQPVTPEEIGLKMASGPEGSYVTAVRTIATDSPTEKRK